MVVMIFLVRTENREGSMKKITNESGSLNEKSAWDKKIRGLIRTAQTPDGAQDLIPKPEPDRIGEIIR